ncbi:energy transducer TonB family protein, partial [Meridianimarinicoccus zhengii]|uniref:energy transducer TonB family protein n=1 Tax=Meridianimarinicoccus zhengii TaxID=2056810 RepID=UPI0013A6AC82
NARIAATRREHTNRRGTVVLAFAVGPGGGLAALDIARSSGDSALDRIALDHVRRAAPFPPPPEGAQTRFSIAFEGRR